jgi:hypothetical protein
MWYIQLQIYISDGSENTSSAFKKVLNKAELTAIALSYGNFIKDVSNLY